MAMCLASTTKSANPKHGDKTFLVSDGVSPATQAVLRTRSKGFGITVRTVHDSEMQSTLESANKGSIIGIMLQYPDVNGGITDYAELAAKAKAKGAKVVVASDLLALTLLKPPGEWGADVCLGNSARFGEFADVGTRRTRFCGPTDDRRLLPPANPGVPAGYGGPHAAFFSCTDALKRKMPGRLVGLSKDTRGEKAYRLALQSEFVARPAQVGGIGQGSICLNHLAPPFLAVTSA
jgi:glycine dehydrogenase